MSVPLVSVICPSYGHSDFIGEAIASVLQQSVSDWELIVVDDCSPDNSHEIVTQFADQDPRIRAVVNPENLGTYGTLERARKLARGRYVAVLNSDDLWQPEKLELQINALQQYPAANFSFAPGVRVDATGARIGEDDLHGDWPLDEHPHQLPNLLSENRILASSVLFRAQGLRFHSPMRYSGDWLVLLRAGKGVAVPQPLSCWRIHGHNTFVRSPKQVQEEIHVRMAIAAHYEASASAATQFHLAQNRMHLAALTLLRGEKGSAVRHALQAARLWPDRTTVRRLARVSLPGARQKLWPGESAIASRDLPPPPDVEGILDYLTSA